MAVELVSFDDLKVFLDLNKVESEYVDLTLIQESVVSMFESYTRRTFTEDAYEEELFIGDSNTVMIPLLAIPIKTVATVTIDEVETSDYKISSYGIALGNKISNQVVKVTYTGGLQSILPALARAALLQTVYEYQNKDSIGIQTTSTDGGTVTKPELGMLKEVAKLLTPFKHPFPVF